jgi:magnesium-dependent phosphatase 1
MKLLQCLLVSCRCITAAYGFCFSSVLKVASNDYYYYYYYYYQKRDLALAATRKNAGSSKHRRLLHHPELIVMDLDNTLWTPELYQLNPKKTPKAKKDIHLFPDVPAIFQTTLAADYPNSADPDRPVLKWAVASRAQNEKWAMQLLQEFRISNKGRTLYDVFHPHIEIQGGTKKHHFQALRKATGVPYKNMIFFDD